MSVRNDLITFINKNKSKKNFTLDELDTAHCNAADVRGERYMETHTVRARISELLRDGVLNTTGTPGKYRRAVNV